MDLINYLASDPDYWDFIDKGRVPEGENLRESMVPRLNSSLPPAMTPSVSFNHGDDANLIGTNISNRKGSKITRWDDSPLTLGTKMGLHEFVERILIVCPQSAGKIYFNFQS